MENELVNIQVKKEITNLFKLYLEILKQIEIEHNIMLDKVDKYTTKDFSDNINYFTKEKYNFLRKSILDQSNDSIRNILSFIELFDFQINPEKLKIAAANQHVVKKMTINSTLSQNL